MTNYVAGFFFNMEMSEVWLIKKNKPKWQAGCLNGIGGKIEDGETPLEAMMREFKEETGHSIYGIWKPFCLMQGPDWSVHFFYELAQDIDEFHKVKTMTDERCVIIEVDNIVNHKTITNIPWLMHMANAHGYR